MPQCMCGCEDCSSCHPGNFETMSSRRVYIKDMTPEEREALRQHDSADDYGFEHLN